MERGRFIETAERSIALAAEAIVIASTVSNPTMSLWADQHLVGWMADSEEKLMAVRPVARRASELRNLLSLTVLRSWLAELEVRFGDQQAGVMLYREHLRHLIDTEAWWGWPFTGIGVIAALAAIGAHRSAAVLLGQVEERLTVLGMLADDASRALAMLRQHLSPGEMDELLTKGRTFDRGGTPRRWHWPSSMPTWLTRLSRACCRRRSC